MKSKLQLIVLSLCLFNALPSWAAGDTAPSRTAAATISTEALGHDATRVFRESKRVEPASFNRAISSHHSDVAPANTRDRAEFPSGGSSNLYLALFILLFAVASRAIKQ